MFRRYKRGMRPAPKAFGESECRIGKNAKSGILGKRLGCRALRRLRWYREIRQILESEGEGQVTARPLPQPLSIEWRGWPQAGKVTARQEPRPTGRAKLLLSPIQSPVAVSVGQCSRPKNFNGPTVRAFSYQFKCITVIHLIRDWAVTTCDFVSL